MGPPLDGQSDKFQPDGTYLAIIFISKGRHTLISCRPSRRSGKLELRPFNVAPKAVKESVNTRNLWDQFDCFSESLRAKETRVRIS